MVHGPSPLCLDSFLPLAHSLVESRRVVEHSGWLQRDFPDHRLLRFSSQRHKILDPRYVYQCLLSPTLSSKERKGERKTYGTAKESSRDGRDHGRPAPCRNSRGPPDDFAS